MKRLLSSRTTFCWKFVFPLIWSGIFGLVTLQLFLGNIAPKTSTGAPSPPAVVTWMKWQFLIMWLLGTVFILWLAGPLKRVFIDNSALYVSNFLSEITIPLADVTKVRENRWAHIGGKQPIIVELRAPCVFGKRIIFIPTGKAPFSWPWKRKLHPVVEKLQAIATRNTSAP